MRVYIAFDVDDGYTAHDAETAAERLVDQCPPEVGAVLTFDGIQVLDGDKKAERRYGFATWFRD